MFHFLIDDPRRTQLDGPQALLTFENDTKGILVPAEINSKGNGDFYFFISYFNIGGGGGHIYPIYQPRKSGLDMPSLGSWLPY